MMDMWVDKEDLDIFSNKEKREKGYYDHRDEDV